MNTIPQTFIDELLARVDIIEVIEIYVTLQKAGREYKACCPFHHEKTPSFTVSPQKQFYYCFGCGAHGNAIKFLMEHQHLSFVEAIEMLATRIGLAIPTTEAKKSSEQPQEKTHLAYALMERVAQYYRYQLKNHAQKETAVEYLRQRGFTGEICREYGVGFAPPGWENVTQQFIADKDLLVAMGLSIEKSDHRYQDRFRNRIMFPIRDRQGRVIAFGGRVLDDAVPKYLNSPETSIFHKSQELYGLYEVLKEERKLEKLLVVEGYLDVIALAQFDIHYAVATLGTALNVQHLRRLFRLVNQVVFCFDGDAAGQRAAWRALELCLSIANDEREIYFLILPEGEDPDSYVRRVGKEVFTQAIAGAHTLTQFLLQHLLAQIDLASLDGKAKLIKLAQPLLAQLPDGGRKALLWEELKRITGLSSKEIEKWSAMSDKAIAQETIQRNTALKVGAQLTPVQRLISVLLQYPELIAHIPATFAIEMPGADSLVLQHLLAELHKSPGIHAGSLLEKESLQAYREYLARLAAWEHILSLDQLQEEMEDMLHGFDKWRVEQQMTQLRQKAAQYGSASLTEEEKSWLRALTNKDSHLEST